MPDRIEAPWTDAQIAALAAHQASPFSHPYTCPDHADAWHKDARPFGHGPGVLRPTRAGWRCPQCHYLQTWAWDPLRDASQDASSAPDRDSL